MSSLREQGTSEVDKETTDQNHLEQRRSERKRKDRQPLFSPDDFASKRKASEQFALTSAAKKRRIVKRRYPAASAADRRHDVLPNGQPFSCDLCQSPYVCNPYLSKQGARGKRSRHMPSPRQKLNPNTGKLLTLCNACAQSLDGPRPPKLVVQVSVEEKEAYCSKAKAFAAQLATQLQDEDAERFYCPSYNKAPCGCLQKYLGGEGML
ncbi:uncharacterized protein [Littorina saxatilis]|uniref:uncharacterized protein n=1 Tax=Littorina saxatilis TaxID=31220 RepID=UPI0038B63309